MLKDSKRLKHHRKSYYPFSKEYPGRSHSTYAIGETRERRKREQRSNVFYALALVFLFLLTFFLVYLAVFLSNRPIREENHTPLPSTEHLVALEMPKEALNGGIALELFLEDLQNENANAVMIEYKAPSGFLSYASMDSTAAGIGASTRAYPTFMDSIETLKAKGYKIIAKYACFKDTLAASSLPGAAVTLADGVSLWLDESAQKDGKPWLNPYADVAVDYLLGLIKEAPTFGADYVLLDGVQFPVGRFAETAVFPYADVKGIAKNAALQEFLQKVKDALGDLEFSVTLTVSDILYGNAVAYDGTLLSAPCNFITIDFQKTAEVEAVLKANNAGFAELSQAEYFVPAAAAVEAKLETDAKDKTVVVLTNRENTTQNIQDAGFAHSISVS